VPLDFGQHQVGAEYKVQDQDMVPFIMSRGLHPVSLKHSRRVYKQPVRGVDQLQILFVADIPDLLHQGLMMDLMSFLISLANEPITILSAILIGQDMM
jgi:hypothetical protein